MARQRAEQECPHRVTKHQLGLDSPDLIGCGPGHRTVGYLDSSNDSLHVIVLSVGRRRHAMLQSE
jgi:hypothetical protein